MLGIIRPCRHGLSDELRAAWWAHLCGMCLALRDEHGQLARLVTNYDGLVVSALLDAQLAAPSRRTAGPCPLRGMRGAEVAIGPGARLAAVASLLLAAARLADHVADGDGVFGRRPVAGTARRLATRWASQGRETALGLAFDPDLLIAVTARQAAVEAAAGAPLVAITAPTEDAVAAVFGHTAVLAGRPRNAGPLTEAGRLFGRVAHLLDAVEDLAADRAAGAWNPLTATGTDLATARALCDDAALGVRLALRDVEFVDRRLVHRLLVHELRHAVRRTFAAAAAPDGVAAGGSTASDSAPPPPGWERQPKRPRRSGVWAGVVGGCTAGVLSTCAAGLCCVATCERCANECGEGCGRACNQACADCECECGCDQACGDCGRACDDCGQSCGSCGDACSGSCDSCGSSCGSCNCQC